MSDVKKKIYLSGPITGTTDYKERFKAKREELEAQGYVVLDPTYILADLSWMDYMTIDLAMLEISDVVYMMKDWKQSAGAKWEHEKALIWEIPIIYEEN